MLGFILFYIVIFSILVLIARIIERCDKCGSISGYDSSPVGYYTVYKCRKCGEKKEF